MCTNTLRCKCYRNKGLTMKQSLVLTYNLKFSLSHVAWPLPIIKQKANAIVKYRSGLNCAHQKNKIKSLDNFKYIYIIVTFCFWVTYICCNSITQGEGYEIKLVLLGTHWEHPHQPPKILKTRSLGRMLMNISWVAKNLYAYFCFKYHVWPRARVGH